MLESITTPKTKIKQTNKQKHEKNPNLQVQYFPLILVLGMIPCQNANILQDIHDTGVLSILIKIGKGAQLRMDNYDNSVI